jgi:hypothetical protein
MRVVITLAALTSVAAGMIASRSESNDTTSTPNVVASQYDGYVAKPDRMKNNKN